MLLKHLYIMSLEYPGPGAALWFGADKLCELRSYIQGFMNGMYFSNVTTTEDQDFFDWLYKKGHFPVKGWCNAIVEEFGDGEPAYIRFFELLHVYLFESLPSWFIDFNKAPQPSPFKNGAGKNRSPDIRNRNHLEKLRNI